MIYDEFGSGGCVGDDFFSYIVFVDDGDDDLFGTEDDFTLELEEAYGNDHVIYNTTGADGVLCGDISILAIEDDDILLTEDDYIIGLEEFTLDQLIANTVGDGGCEIGDVTIFVLEDEEDDDIIGTEDDYEIALETFTIEQVIRNIIAEGGGLLDGEGIHNIVATQSSSGVFVILGGEGIAIRIGDTFIELSTGGMVWGGEGTEIYKAGPITQFNLACVNRQIDFIQCGDGFVPSITRCNQRLLDQRIRKICRFRNR